MARQVLPIVGAVVGAYFGAPQLGFAIGSILGNAVDPQVIKGPKIGDAGVQTSAEGAYRPVIYGTGAVMGNVIERGNRKVTKRRTQQGKGGPVTEEERVSWTFAIRICEGPIAGLLRIWEDEKLVYDNRANSGIPEETVDFASRCRIYLGDEEQLPDPDLEAYKGIGNVNAYRGTVYIVFPNYDLTDRRESIPNYRFEVSTTITGLSWDGQWDGPFTYPSGLQVGTNIWASHWDQFVLVKGSGRSISPDGETWDTYGTDDPLSVAENPNNGILAFISAAGVLQRSMDGGITVTDMQSGVAVGSSSGIRWSPVEFGFVGYTGSRPVKIASDASSASFGDPIDLGTNPSWIHIPGDGYFVGGQDGVVYQSSNLMAGYVEISSIGMPSGILNELHYDPSHDVVFAACTQGRIYRSIDHCNTWDLVVSVGTGINFASGFYSEELQITYINGHGSSSDNIVTFRDGLTPEISSSADMNRWAAFAYSPPLRIVSAGASGSTWVAHLASDETEITVGSIVREVCRRAIVDDPDIDVSPLTDPVFGVVLAGDYTCADAIKALMPVYTFDSSEHDAGLGYKINFIKRGANVQYTLEEDDFISIPDKTTRFDSLERPRVLHLSYQNPTIGYAPAKASPSRNSPDVNVVGEVSAQVPASFVDVDEAWQRADVLLKQAWVEIGGEEEYTISYANLDLVSTDCIGIAIRDQVRRCRIVQAQTVDGSVQLKLIADRQSAYTSKITGVPVPAPTPPLPSIVGNTVHWPLDIPALNDNNDRLLTYGGATGQTEAWYGALVQRSWNAGTTWVDTATFRVNSIMGVLTDSITDASQHYTDTTNVIRVALYMPDDTIDSISQTEFLSEGGSLALSWEDSGSRRWEILQYRDAVQVSDGTWELSPLLRGRLNTETAAHPTGSFLVLLDTVQSYDNTTADLDDDIAYRATSLGNSPDGAQVYSEEYTGQSQREWPVAHLFLDHVANAVNARTVPRHRFGTEDRPVRSVNWTGYRWTATDGASTITRDTIEDTTSFDVTGWASPVTVTVSQLNRFTGQGPAVSEQIS